MSDTVLTVLKSDVRLHEHGAVGRIPVQAIAGHIRMHVQDKVIDLPAQMCTMPELRRFGPWRALMCARRGGHDE